jgi:hypothetical protein
VSQELALPDTKLVREARALVTAVAPPDLWNHSVRAYLLGRAYAGTKLASLDYDDEGFALAAVFHDLGLCAGYRAGPLPFTFKSSRALRDFLGERGVAKERVEPLVDAIDFHMQLLPRWKKGPVAGLLQIGAWMDAMGLRRWSVSEVAREIEAVHPRLGVGVRLPARLFVSALGVRACAGLVFPGLLR